MYVEIGHIEASNGGAWLGLNAEHAEGDYAASAIVVSRNQDGSNPVLTAELPQPVTISQSFVARGKLKRPTRAELELKWRELLRRLSTQEITWSKGGAGTSFFKLPSGFAQAGVAVRGDAKLDLSGLGNAPPTFSGTFSLRGEIQATIPAKGTFVQSIALVVAVHATGLPKLRIDFDDFNFGLPECNFANLDLLNGCTLPLPQGPKLDGVARAFDSLAKAIGETVKVEVTPQDQSRLKLDVNGGVLAWRIEDPATQDLAKFRIEAKRPNGVLLFTIEDFTAEGTADKGKLTGAVRTEPEFRLNDGRKALGPLTVEWNEVTVKPTAEAILNDPADVTLRAEVSFKRLMIYATDDPSAVISFAGKVEITPSGGRIVTLRLVRPYPFVLLAKAGTGLAHAAASVLEFLLELKPTAATDLDGLRSLFDVLGRIAAAIGRATLFAAEAAGELLIAIAEALGRMLAKLADLIGDAATGGGRYLAFEVRIATDPFELRQVLVTLRNRAGATDPFSLSALGLKLEVHPGFEPGLLLDFHARPGAYLIVSPTGTATSPKLVTLSTDLWLGKKDAPARALRDANGQSGERAADDGKPLISVLVSTKDRNDFVLLVAGLCEGRAVFLRRITEVDKKSIAGFSGSTLVTAKGAFSYDEKASDAFVLDLNFEEDRVLPLLGMGEPGKEPAPGGSSDGFLAKLQNSLSQTVWVKKWEAPTVTDMLATGSLLLGVKAAGVETQVALNLTVDLMTLRVELDAELGTFKLKSKRIEERALGLVWVIEQVVKEELEADEPVEMFELDFKDGETSFKLNKEKARMEIRFADLSSDGKGVALQVESFGISRAGLDLLAKANGASTTLNGINTPFEFTTGVFEIRSGRLVQATIGGRGSLPRALVGDVDCSVLLDFRQDPASNEIVLQKGKVEFGKRGEPIKCHTTRFTLTINELDIAFARDGGYHFYFLITGAIEFTPREGEFADGLLKYLKDVRIDLEQAPLTADPSVLLKHVSFQKALSPKKSFKLFDLFEFELRGFGFHPSSDKFGGSPAMNISGQIKFAEIGDVMQPSIDFHGLWIAPPEGDDSMPRVRCDGLGVNIGLSGAARIRGTVLAVDPKTDWLQLGATPPAGYDTYGFLGEGEITIEGLGSMAASMGFLEIAPKDRPNERKKAFYLYLEAKKLAIEVPVVIWTFWIREVGFGFGYRYTLQGIKAAEQATSTAKLITALDDISKRQGDLSRFAAWTPEPQGDKFTLAMRALIQTMPAQEKWDQEYEKTAEEPFLFDIVAALRSDMTFLMSARGWVATNYNDFLIDTDGSKLRNNPGLRGYLFISAPRSELLMRGIGDSRGFVGDRLGGIQEIKQALKSVDWSMTLYVNPKLFHIELGWPNELVARLRDDPNFRVIVRGGLIFRVAEDGILWGVNIEAEAFIGFSGGAGGGSLGVAVEASLRAKFLARLIAFLSPRGTDSLIYGLISLDASLEFRIKAWMEIDLGIDTITLRISFSRSIQFSAAVELALSDKGVGARVKARLAVSAFGCTLSVGINFTINSGKLEEARSRVQRFMALGIASESAPEAAKAVAAIEGDKQVADDAKQAEAPYSAPVEPKPDTPPGAPKPSIERTGLGDPIRGTDYWLVLRAGGEGVNDAYGLLVPRVPDRKADPSRGGFYAAPYGPWDEGKRTESNAHKLTYIGGTTPVVERWKNGSSPGFSPLTATETAVAVWSHPVPSEGGEGGFVFSLGHLFDECFLYDSHWSKAAPFYRVTTGWAEPKAKFFDPARRIDVTDENQRRRERDRVQRERVATAAKHPLAAACHDARSTVLASFIDQFIELAARGEHKVGDAHVTDLGLVFRGKIEELQKLRTIVDDAGNIIGGVKVETCIGPEKNGAAPYADGAIEIFNPSSTWFENADPVLAYTKEPKVEPDGVKLDWRLVLFGDEAKSLGDERKDPEQHLSHYEIICELEGQPRWEAPRKVKPCATEGGVDEETGVCDLLAADWQFLDDLADLDDVVRAAILPKSGEENALLAADYWNRAFGDRDTVFFTYSVSPVDIAGTKGSERSFVVEARRPQAPIRPATAELRFHLTTPKQATMGADRPDNLTAVLAIKDKSWARDGAEPLDDGFFAHRLYRLIVDPEDIVPSGNFGSDAMSDRPLGAAGAGRSGDELTFTFRRSDFLTAEYLGTSASAFEPDDDARKAFDRWLRFAAPKTSTEPLRQLLNKAYFPEQAKPRDAQSDFFNALWSRVGDVRSRVSTRFYLETLVVVTESATLPANKGIPQPSVSRRVPVEFELVVMELDPQTKEPISQPALLRPEAFEWPVRLDMPPLDLGQVRAASGIAMFTVPTPQASLATMFEDAGVATQRDPERRVLTRVEWDAKPDWASSTTTQASDASAVAARKDPLASRRRGRLAAQSTKPHAIHASTIGGYELYEMDIDDLAPFDSKGSTPFNKDKRLWRRARRVARAQLTPASVAMLTPHGNQDLLGWQAHYPSESWRTMHRTPGAGPKPIRRGFWSSRESTLRFPDRSYVGQSSIEIALMRRRLLPVFDDGIAATLMRYGSPTAIYVRLSAGNRAPELVDVIVQHTGADGKVAAGANLKSLFTETDGSQEWAGWRKFTLKNPPKNEDPRLTPSDIRALQLCLARPAGQDFETNKQVLKIAGTFVAKVTKTETRSGEIDIPLDYSSRLHPVIEEVIAELGLDVQTAGSRPCVYRRYRPVVQQPSQVAATDVADFFAQTAASKDPYGWGVLQLLGLAATVRLFDGDLDRFERPAPLLKRIDLVMGGVIARYQEERQGLRYHLGAPFVDVLLQPGKDRIAGAFDASEAPAERGLDPDHCLAVAQISLRPTPQRVWSYHRVAGFWKEALPLKVPEVGTPYAAGMAFQVNPAGLPPFELLRSGDARLVEMAAEDAAPVTLPALSQPVRVSKDLDPGLTLILRSRGLTESDFANLLTLKEVCRTQSKRLVGDSYQIVNEDTLVDAVKERWLAHLEKPGNLDAPDVEKPGLAIDLKATPWEDLHWADVDAFSLFPPKDAQAWEDAFKTDDLAKVAYASLRANIVASMSKMDGLGPVGVGMERSDIALYLEWSQRFLDHGGALSGERDHPSVALAAPIKATPWRLAAERDGTVSLSFLHSDRWAHARAYGVKPFGRYQELLIGAGSYADDISKDRIEARSQLEQQITLGDGEEMESIGYAVAVSPRTEKVEPPMLLGSSLWRPESGTAEPAWQLVVARHTEENLAYSNRSLFGRLGWEGTALSFVRDYFEPAWPARIAKAAENVWNEPELHPVKPPALPVKVPASDKPPIGAKELNRLAENFPSLWKGADIYRFPALPHHYRVTIIAAARAGIVVSPLTAASQSEFEIQMADPGSLRDVDPRAPVPESGVATLQLCDDGYTRLALQWRLLSHADLMPQATRREWVDGDLDVAHWPDPDVIYAVQRRFEAHAKLVAIDEDAEIRLVARPAYSADEQKWKPVVARARGTRYAGPADRPDGMGAPSLQRGEIVVRREAGTGSFLMTLPLPLAGQPADSPPSKAIASRALQPQDDIDQIAKFNNETLRTGALEFNYAVIRSPYRLRLDYKPNGAAPDAAFAAVKELETLAREAAASLGEKREAFWSREVGLWAAAANAWIEKVEAGATPMPGNSAEIVSAVRLPHEIEGWWRDGLAFDLNFEGAAKDSSFDRDALSRPLLSAFDVPAGDEFEALDAIAVGNDWLKAAVSTLRALSREMLSGGAEKITVRAVHGRAGPAGAVGIASVDLEWPTILGDKP